MLKSIKEAWADSPLAVVMAVAMTIFMVFVLSMVHPS